MNLELLDTEDKKMNYKHIIAALILSAVMYGMIGECAQSIEVGKANMMASVERMQE